MATHTVAPGPARLTPTHAALAVTLAGLAVRLWLIARPVDVLVARYAADDFFYYLQIAWHIAHGQGSTFDGGVSHTNGFQPLFMGLLVPGFWAGLTKLAAVRYGLLVQAVAAAGAGWTAFRVLEHAGAAWSGVLAAGLLAVNLFFVLPTLTGFEMALALAASLLAVRAWQAGVRPVWVGALCGLAILARVDGLILAGWLSLTYLWRRDLRGFAWVVLGGALLVAPWAAWSLHAFGTVSLDSGAVKSHLRSLHDARLALRVAWGALPRAWMPERALALVGPWGGAACAVAAGLLVATSRPRGAVAVLLAYAGLLSLAYALLIDPHEQGAMVRYFFPVFAVLVLAVAAHPWLNRRSLVLALLALHVADVAFYLRWDRHAPPAMGYVSAAQRLAPPVLADLPPQARVASFDSGSLGYFSDRPVVNLDGLVNHDVAVLTRTCTDTHAACWLAYMHAHGVRYVVGGTGFGWTRVFPDWRTWPQVYASPPLVDGEKLVVLALPE